MNKILNFALMDLVKDFVIAEVSNGEPREKIRITQVEYNEPEKFEHIRILTELDYINPTEDPTVYVCSEPYYDFILNYREKFLTKFKTGGLI